MAQRVKTTRHLRAQNCRLILEHIRTDGPISAARLSEGCQLRPSTISNILKELRTAGCIRYCGFGSSTHQGGKRPLLIELDRAHGLLAGVEISPRNVRAALRNFALEDVVQASVPRPTGRGTEDLAQTVIGLLESVQADAGGCRLLAIGIGSAEEGAGDGETGLPTTLLAALETRFECPVVADVRARLAACGEWVIQEQRGPKDLVFIDVDRDADSQPRVGVGLILDGRVYRGRGDAGRLLSGNPTALAGRGLEEILGVVSTLLDPAFIILRSGDPDVVLPSAAGEPGIVVKRSRFGDYAVAEGGVAVAFDRVLEAMS